MVTFDRGGIKTWPFDCLSGSMASFDETFPRFAACVCLFYSARCGTEHLVLVLRVDEQSDPICPFHAVHDFGDYYISLKSPVFLPEVPGPAPSFLTE